MTREPGSYSRWVFQASALGDESISPTAEILTDSTSMLDRVAGVPAAIGYVSAGLLDARVKPLFVDDALPDGRVGSAAGYPMMQSISIITRRDAKQQVTDFIAFVLSAEGQGVVGQSYGRIRQ